MKSFAAAALALAYALGVITALAVNRAEINACRTARQPNCDLQVLRAVAWPVMLWEALQ